MMALQSFFRRVHSIQALQRLGRCTLYSASPLCPAPCGASFVLRTFSGTPASPPHQKKAAWVSRTGLPERIDGLATAILAANWADHVVIVQNLGLWQSELAAFENEAEYYLKGSPQLRNTLKRVQHMMDCLVRSTDLRDHAIELLQLFAKKKAHPELPVEVNAEAHMMALNDGMKQLISEFPDFAPKIEETVGQALALLRQRDRFTFEAEQKYFF